MRTRRALLLAGAGSGAGALLLACTPGAGNPAPGTGGAPKGKVTFMSQGADPLDEQRYKPLVEAFNARGGPVTMELIQGDAGGSAVAAQGKVIAMVASGTAPDLFWTHAYVSPNLAKLGLLQDINPYIRRDKDFKTSNYFEAPLKDYEADGKQYGVPREATTTVMVVNKELFQRSGVALPGENWTWDDFLKAAQQMTQGSGGSRTWGVAGFSVVAPAPGVPSHSWGIYTSYPRVWQEGSDIVDRSRTKFTLHQSPAVDQMQWLADLVTRHRVHPIGEEFPGNNIKEVWNTGRIGMYVSISVYTNYIEAPFDWDIVHLPRGASRATRTASAGHSMTAAGQNKDAAWEALKYLGSKPAYEHWAKLGLTIPTFKEVAESALVLNPNSPPKSAKVATDAFSYARPEPVSGDWGNVGTEITKAMAEVYAGKTDARGALTPIVPVVEGLLSKTPAAPAAPAAPTTAPR
ncbi:MAG TPA: sugar ABC transporter substrate-binding protein [Chloroflexota bacterium]|nr:sugar ABC transporter substrate-binding protein [Chloroflexota bacterium]